MGSINQGLADLLGWLGAAIAALVAAIAPAAMPAPAEDARLLADQFEWAVYGPPPGDSGPFRWVAAPVVVESSALPFDLQVKQAAAQLGLATLPAVAAGESSGRIHALAYLNAGELAFFLRRLRGTPGYLGAFGEPGRCVTVLFGDATAHTLSQAHIMVSQRDYAPFTGAPVIGCLQRSLTRALGFPHEACLYSPSLFCGSNTGLQNLERDRRVMALLQDPGLLAGATGRRAVMDRLRAIMLPPDRGMGRPINPLLAGWLGALAGLIAAVPLLLLVGLSGRTLAHWPNAPSAAQSFGAAWLEQRTHPDDQGAGHGLMARARHWLRTGENLPARPPAILLPVLVAWAIITWPTAWTIWRDTAWLTVVATLGAFVVALLLANILRGIVAMSFLLQRRPRPAPALVAAVLALPCCLALVVFAAERFELLQHLPWLEAAAPAGSGFLARTWAVLEPAYTLADLRFGALLPVILYTGLWVAIWFPLHLLLFHATRGESAPAVTATSRVLGGGVALTGMALGAWLGLFWLRDPQPAPRLDAAPWPLLALVILVPVWLMALRPPEPEIVTLSGAARVRPRENRLAWALGIVALTALIAACLVVVLAAMFF